MPLDLSPLWISLKTAVTATLLASLFGVAAARWMMTYRGRARGWLDGIFTLPLVLPPTVVGFLLLLLLGKNGPVGQALNPLGVTVIFTWTATVIAATVVAFPLMYKTVLSALDQIDLTLVGSARTLGASEWRIFWQVILPLAWPGLVAGTILAFARALGEFGATLMVGGSIPGVTQTIPITIFFAAEAGRMQVAFAWVLLMVAISLIVIVGINQGHRGRGNQGQPSQATYANMLTQRLFNGLYFGRFKASLFGQRSTAPSPQLHFSPGPPRAVENATPTLQVALEKRMPRFQLQVQFQAGGAPLGLLGASGSGKSMALRCIAGLETPTQGRIVLNGRILFDSRRRIDVPSRDRNVGLVFQNYALFPHLTVAQNIAFGMTDAKPQRVGAVAQYLHRMGLTGLGDRYPHQLSGGQQQRVALARALAIRPDILLLDEPLSALDTYLRSQIEALLIETLSTYPGVVLFITHKLEEVYRVCDDILVLSHGRVLANAPKAEIFARPPTVEVARITECKNVACARPSGPAQIQALDWDCQLEVTDPIPPNLGYVGIRAHHIQFDPVQCDLQTGHLRKGHAQTDQINTFPGWLAAISETQHRVTLYIKLHTAPETAQDYHLQAEVYRDRWEQLRYRPLPWAIYLAPVHLIMMPGEGGLDPYHGHSVG